MTRYCEHVKCLPCFRCKGIGRFISDSGNDLGGCFLCTDEPIPNGDILKGILVKPGYVHSTRLRAYYEILVEIDKPKKSDSMTHKTYVDMQIQAFIEFSYFKKYAKNIKEWTREKTDNQILILELSMVNMNLRYSRRYDRASLVPK